MEKSAGSGRGRSPKYVTERAAWESDSPACLFLPQRRFRSSSGGPVRPETDSSDRNLSSLRSRDYLLQVSVPTEIQSFHTFSSPIQVIALSLLLV